MEEPLRSAKFAHLIATPLRPPRYPVSTGIRNAWGIRLSSVARTALFALASCVRWPSVVCFAVLPQLGRWEMSWPSGIFHGNSARISRTCLLLKCGAPTPALRPNIAAPSTACRPSK